MRGVPAGALDSVTSAGGWALLGAGAAAVVMMGFCAAVFCSCSGQYEVTMVSKRVTTWFRAGQSGTESGHAVIVYTTARVTVPVTVVMEAPDSAGGMVEATGEEGEGLIAMVNVFRSVGSMGFKLGPREGDGTSPAEIDPSGNGAEDVDVLGGSSCGAATTRHAPGIFPAASGPAGTGASFDCPSPQETWFDMNSALFV